MAQDAAGRLLTGRFLPVLASAKFSGLVSDLTAKITPRFPHGFSSGGETRTLNQPVNSRLLCRLSYPRSIEIEGTGCGGVSATRVQLPLPRAGDGIGSTARVAAAPIVLVAVEAVRDLRTVGTFQRWAKARTVRPTLRLPGGEYRWSLADLTDQLRPEDVSVEDTPNRPSVITAIVTSGRGVLIGHRHDGRPPWTFIAGEQEPGETYTDTIIREVKEETGLEITAGDVIGERVHPKTDRHMVYVAAQPTGKLDAVVGDPDELSEVKWATLAEADELLPGMFPVVREHLERTLTN